MISPAVRAAARPHPFNAERLPVLARLYRAAFSPPPRSVQRLVRVPYRAAFSILYRCGMGGAGTMTVAVKGAQRRLSFDARNLQFASVYMPAEADGYESETAAVLDALVTPHATFYDVGSNWGYYALWLASRETFEGTVYAFEPMPSAFRDLARLVSEAGVTAQVFCHNVGLSDCDRNASMTIPDGRHSGIATVASSGETSIVLRTLDTLALPPPDVIKMDVEDHELQAIRGGCALLRDARPFVMFESYWRRDAATHVAPFQLLSELGYRFFYPVWVRRLGDGVFDEAAAPGAHRELLALVPFEWWQRFLFKQHFNVLACHHSRLAELNAHFSD